MEIDVKGLFHTATKLSTRPTGRSTHLILTPTAAALPWPAEAPYPDRIADRPAGPRDHAVFTGWANIAGVPAISLPVALSKAGLPIGVQLAAGFGADAVLLAFAGDFLLRHPPPPLVELDKNANATGELSKIH
jgi:Asp-tRNA(Asn)/Glu-tRNA(Gln) amidotransferase A subunit family amidase